jgi:hypothetical protein
VKDSIKKIIKEEVEIQEKEQLNEGALDNIQKALTAIGVVYDPADAVNVLISLVRTRWSDAMVNAVSMIPAVGTGIGLSLKKLLKVFPVAKLTEVFGKILTGGATAAVTSLVQASANNPELFKGIVNGIKEKKSTLLAIIDKAGDSTDAVFDKLPNKIKKMVDPKTIESTKQAAPNLKQFFATLTSLSDDQIDKEMNKAKESSKA